MSSVHQLPIEDQGSKPKDRNRGAGIARAVGLGLVTGAADDDPSAVGTYASAGAKIGPSFLWISPALFPMMAAVVYLSSKLGLVSGEGLFALVRRHHPRWLLITILLGVLVGNTIEAGADIGGMAAALALIIPIRAAWIAISVGVLILALQIWGSYTLIRNVFRVLAMALLAYVGSAILAHPDLGSVLHGTFIPEIHFNEEFLTMVVAVIGTSLSAYLFTWQSNEEVEEKIAAGRRRLEQRRQTSRIELRQSMWDIIFGMFFSDIVMYSIILSTATALFKSGMRDISSAADAAQALRPIAGNAAGLLFALGIIGVGFLAVPVMTTGAAYDLCQSVGWEHGLYRRPAESKKFYAAIGFFTLCAIGFNFIGINPMKALVFAGLIQGFSTPPLLLLIMRMTSDPAIMGARANGRAINIIGWITTAVVSLASLALVISWLF